VRSRWESVGSGCEIENYVCVWKVGRAAEADGSGFAEGKWTREGGASGGWEGVEGGREEEEGGERERRVMGRVMGTIRKQSREMVYSLIVGKKEFC
jgi:hypothetical protein